MHRYSLLPALFRFYPCESGPASGHHAPPPDQCAVSAPQDPPQLNTAHARHRDKRPVPAKPHRQPAAPPAYHRDREPELRERGTQRGKLYPISRQRRGLVDRPRRTVAGKPARTAHAHHPAAADQRGPWPEPPDQRPADPAQPARGEARRAHCPAATAAGREHRACLRWAPRRLSPLGPFQGNRTRTSGVAVSVATGRFGQRPETTRRSRIGEPHPLHTGRRYSRCRPPARPSRHVVRA